MKMERKYWPGEDDSEDCHQDQGSDKTRPQGLPTAQPACLFPRLRFTERGVKIFSQQAIPVSRSFARKMQRTDSHRFICLCLTALKRGSQVKDGYAVAYTLPDTLQSALLFINGLKIADSTSQR